MPAFVLVVDDDPMLLQVAADMLEELGCRVITSPSGADALRVLKERPEITTLLTDVQMPGLSGIELAAQAQRLRCDLYIVFASGRERVDGAPFLHKPFDREALSRIVAC
jgi:CheY-like chemotaxis protein